MTNELTSTKICDMAKEATKRDCLVCKKGFSAKRDDARFCSPNCRQKYVRNPQAYIIEEALKEQKKVSEEKKVTIQDLNEKTEVKPVTPKPPKSNYSIDTRKPFMNDAIRKKLGLKD